MGRIDVSRFQFMSVEDFRVLKAVETGLRNHEFVPAALVKQFASLPTGGALDVIRRMQDNNLVAFRTDRHRNHSGYRLTEKGYDYLALKKLSSSGKIDSFGSQIGTGKESVVFCVEGNGECLALKFHRLGHTCFRKIKLLRDYHGDRTHTSWLQLSAISAAKEYWFMKMLHERGFPVPLPVAHNRHAVVMSLIDGIPLYLVEKHSPHVEHLYEQCMNLMTRLAEHGLIHCDFNQFNLLVGPADELVVIDFPQMVSTSHPNAEFMFNRDVECLVEFFWSRFKYRSEDVPVLSEIERVENLDELVRASGFRKSFRIFDDFWQNSKEADTDSDAEEEYTESDVEEREEQDSAELSKDNKEDGSDKQMEMEKRIRKQFKRSKMKQVRKMCIGGNCKEQVRHRRFISDTIRDVTSVDSVW